MKKFYICFVALLLSFFTALNASAFEVKLTNPVGEVESFDELRFVNAEDGGRILVDYGAYETSVAITRAGYGIVKEFRGYDFEVVYPSGTGRDPVPPIEVYVAFDDITEPGDYTVVVGEGFFCDESGNSCPRQELKFTVKEPAPAAFVLNLTIADSEVKSFDELRFVNTNGHIMVNKAYASPIALVRKCTGLLKTFTGYDFNFDYAGENQHDELPVAAYVSLSDAVTTAGEYTVTVPAGYFVDGNGTASTEQIFHFTVVPEPLPSSFVVSLAIADSDVKSLDELRFTNATTNGGIMVSDRAYKSPISLVRKGAGLLKTFIGSDFDFNYPGASKHDEIPVEAFVSLSNAITTAGEYTVNVPEGYFVDGNGVPCAEQIFHFNVVSEPLPTSFVVNLTIADSEVKSFDELRFTNAAANGGIMVNNAYASPIALVRKGAGLLKTFKGYDFDFTYPGESKYDEIPVEAYVSLSEAITTAGEYTVTVPAGYFVDGNGVSCAEQSFHFTVVPEPLPSSFVVNLAIADSDVKSLEELRFTNATTNGGIMVSDKSYKSPIALIRKDAGLMKTFIGSDFDFNYPDASKHDEVPVEAFISLSDAITTAGEYTVTVPEGYFVDGNGVPCAEQSFHFTIVAAPLPSSFVVNLAIADSEVKSLDELCFTNATTDGGIMVSDRAYESPISLVRKGAGLLKTFIGSDFDFTFPGVNKYDEVPVEAFISLSEAITTAGEYTVTVPEGYFVDANGVPCAEQIYHFTIVAEPLPSSFVVNLAIADCDVKSLDELRFTNATADGGIMVSSRAYESPISLVRKGAGLLKTFIGSDFDFTYPGASKHDEVPVEAFISLSNAITTAGEYTVNVPEGYFVDGNGVPCAEQIFHFTVVGDPAASTFVVNLTIADSEVKSFDELRFTNSAANGGIMVNNAYASPIALVRKGAGLLKTFTGYDFDFTYPGVNKYDEIPVEAYVSLSEAITTAGEYTVTVPAGYFVDGNGVSCAEQSFHFTVVPEPLPSSFVVNLAIADSDVKSLEELRFTNATTNGGIMVSDKSYKSPIALIRKDAGLMKTFIGSDFDFNYPDASKYGEIPVEAYVSLSDAITTAGEYTVTVPEGYFVDGNGVPCAEQSFHFTIVAAPLPSSFVVNLAIADSEVKSLDELRFTNATTDGGIMVSEKSYITALALLRKGAGVVKTFNGDAFDFNYPGVSNNGEVPVEAFISLSEAITTDGVYTVKVPAGYFVDGNGVPCAEQKFQFTLVSDPSVSTTLTVTPEAGETESLRQFKVSHAAGVYLSENCVVRLTDMLGNVVAEFTNSDMEAVWGTNKNLPDAFSFQTEEAIVAPGTYTLSAEAGAFTIGANMVPADAFSISYTIPGEVIIPNYALAQKLAGDYTALQEGETAFNDYFDWESFTRKYKMTVEADGEMLLFKNFNDYGLETALMGVVDGSNKQVLFSTQRVYIGWYSYVISNPEGSEFVATISDDFSTLTFDPITISQGEEVYEKIESFVLTRLPDPVIEWSVKGTTHFEAANGGTSAFVADNNTVTLTKYVQGDDVQYELSSLGGLYEYAPAVRFTVNPNGTLNYLNAYAGMWYDSVNTYIDSVVAYSADDNGQPASGITGDAESGEMYFLYEYYEDYMNFVPSETGKFTFTWGESSEQDIVTSIPDGGKVEEFDEIVYTFTDAEVVEINFENNDVTIVDENGNTVSENIGITLGEDMNQIVVNTSNITEPGTYTITIAKGSILIDGVLYDKDIVITITVYGVWKGDCELPEEAASMDDLTSLPVTFCYANEVVRSGYSILGALYDTNGKIFALIFSNGGANNFAGSVDVAGNVATVKFEKMNDLRGDKAAMAEAYARKVSAFITPATGKATVYIAPKSFKVDGKVFNKSIVKNIEITGSGETTGLESIILENATKQYDLQGRRIARPVDGQIIINNGKKVIK